MSERFVRQLEELHVELITMGSLCEKAISLSAKAIQGEGGMTLIGKIFETEKEIDAQEKEIENLCMKLLLQQQPVAVFPPQHIDWRRSRSQCRYIIVVGRRLP